MTLRRPGDRAFNAPAVHERGVGHLDEVLDNLGVFRAAAEELVVLCPSGFRRIPISQGTEFYFSLQALAPDQIAARGLFEPKAVEALVREHLGRGRNHADRLWTLMMLELWVRRSLDTRGTWSARE